MPFIVGRASASDRCNHSDASAARGRWRNGSGTQAMLIQQESVTNFDDVYYYSTLNLLLQLSTLLRVGRLALASTSAATRPTLYRPLRGYRTIVLSVPTRDGNGPGRPRAGPGRAGPGRAGPGLRIQARGPHGPKRA